VNDRQERIALSGPSLPWYNKQASEHDATTGQEGKLDPMH
jgi:hypothetical protein